MACVPQLAHRTLSVGTQAISHHREIPVLRSRISALPSAGAMVQERGAMVTITGLAQWGIGGPVSLYLLIPPIWGEGGNKHLTLAVQEQLLFFSKLKLQHLGFNCSIGTLK